MLCRFASVVCGVHRVPMSRMSMVCCLFVITGFVMLSRFLMVCGCVTEMLGRFLVMVSCFVRHSGIPLKSGFDRSRASATRHRL